MREMLEDVYEEKKKNIIRKSKEEGFWEFKGKVWRE